MSRSYEVTSKRCLWIDHPLIELQELSETRLMDTLTLPKRFPGDSNRKKWRLSVEGESSSVYLLIGNYTSLTITNTTTSDVYSSGGDFFQSRSPRTVENKWSIGTRVSLINRLVWTRYAQPQCHRNSSSLAPRGNRLSGSFGQTRLVVGTGECSQPGTGRNPSPQRLLDPSLEWTSLSTCRTC